MAAKNTGDESPIGRRSPVVRPLADLWFTALSAARIYRRLVLLARPLRPSAPELTAPSEVQIAALAPEEIGAYLAFRPEQTGAEIRARLSRGYVCFAAWHDRQIVHAAWGATKIAPIDYLSHEIELDRDEVFIFDAFTAPASRGRNLSPLRAVAMGRHYHDRGYRRVLTAVHPENRVGFRPLEKVGTQPVGLIGYVGVGPLRWHFCHGRE
jgi:hypothetical protein